MRIADPRIQAAFIQRNRAVRLQTPTLPFDDPLEHRKDLPHQIDVVGVLEVLPDMVGEDLVHVVASPSGCLQHARHGPLVGPFADQPERAVLLDASV